MSTISIALLVTLVTAQSATDSLEARIRARVAQVPGATVGVAYRNLGRQDSLFINADSSYHAASTMKVPVMIELFRKVDAGSLRLDDSVALRNEFRSIVDSSVYSLDAGDDSDSSIYRRVGGKVTVGELIEHMITRSSNLATNAVIDLAGGGAEITATMRRLGARDIQVRRGVEDGKAFRAGLNNTTTARDLATILTALETGSAASKQSTQSMRDILLQQEFNDGIPAGLPPNTPVAHKTGWITGIAHDAAIVYPPGRAPFVLVVLTGGIESHAAANALTADIARMVWEEAVKAP